MIGLNMISMESTLMSVDPDLDMGANYWHPGKSVLGLHKHICDHTLLLHHPYFGSIL